METRLGYVCGIGFLGPLDLGRERPEITWTTSYNTECLDVLLNMLCDCESPLHHTVSSFFATGQVVVTVNPSHTETGDNDKLELIYNYRQLYF